MSKKLKEIKETLHIHLGRSNLSATIFVPSDCTNNCAFCTSKESYHIKKPNLKKVLKKIKKLNKVDWIQSFVLTGGEPFADLEILQVILDTISPFKQVYVNTTLPTNRYTEDELVEFVNNSRIDGINLSRHWNTFHGDQIFFSKNISKDTILHRIQKPVKINVITSKGTDIEMILNRWANYKNVIISFRADYRNITLGSLKDLQDNVIEKILSIPRVSYISHGGCDVCFDVTFSFNKQLYFSYHKGLENSSVQFGNELLINDVIISQDGKAYYDWDQSESKLKIKKGKFIVYKTKEIS